MINRYADTLLRYLDTYSRGGNKSTKIFADLRIPVEYREKVLAKLREPGYVTVVTHDERSTIITITEKGIDFIANSSFETEKVKQEKKGFTKWYDTEKGKAMFDDYAKTKKIAIAALIIAAVVLLYEIVRLVLEFYPITPAAPTH